MIATAETRTAVMDGAAGRAMRMSKDSALEVFHQSGKRKGTAPAPDALRYVVLALLGESCAEMFASI